MRKFTTLLFISLLFFSCKTNKEVINKTLTSSEVERSRFADLYIKATNLAMLENTDKAIMLYEQCKELRPKNASTYYELSRLYALKRNAGLAYKNAERAYEINPSNKWYLLQRAIVLKATSQNKKAIEAYEDLIKLDKKNLSALYELAQLYQVSEMPKKAAETLSRIETISGKNPQLSYQKYMLLMDAGEETDALKEISSLLKQSPENGMGNLAMAQYYEKKGEEEKVFDKMVFVFEDAGIRTDTKLNILMDYITKSKGDTKKQKETEKLIATMKRVNPKDVESYVAAGDYYLSKKETKKANENYEQALEFSTNSYPIYMQLLENEFNEKNYSKVIEYATNAIELYPTQPVLFLYKGMGYKERKDFVNAVSSFKMGAGILVDDEKLEFEFYSKLGETYNDQKDYLNSDKYFEKALNVNGLEPFMLNNYSYYLSLRKDKLEKAAELSKKSNNIYPKNASFNDTYGWILFQQEKFEEAEIWLKKSIENGGNLSGTVLEHYGDVMIQLNKESEALKYWNLAKEAGDFSDKLTDKIKDKKYYE
ncbi:MAG: tetratricopeptide (TPR) repeat protein [Flavobacteriales bacterium]|jgi:tetratricopeptide (TPR) repeat protein